MPAPSPSSPTASALGLVPGELKVPAGLLPASLMWPGLAAGLPAQHTDAAPALCSHLPPPGRALPHCQGYLWVQDGPCSTVLPGAETNGPEIQTRLRLPQSLAQGSCGAERPRELPPCFFMLPAMPIFTLHFRNATEGQTPFPLCVCSTPFIYCLLACPSFADKSE